MIDGVENLLFTTIYTTKFSKLIFISKLKIVDVILIDHQEYGQNCLV